MVPTIVGMSVVIVGLLAWNVYLTVFMFDVRDTAADALDALINAGESVSSRVRALESPAYPKYSGTVAGSENSENAACEGIDPVWGAHDLAVAEALTQAQTPQHRATGAINTDPNSSAFFEEI